MMPIPSPLPLVPLSYKKAWMELGRKEKKEKKKRKKRESVWDREERERERGKNKIKGERVSWQRGAKEKTSPTEKGKEGGEEGGEK